MKKLLTFSIWLVLVLLCVEFISIAGHRLISPSFYSKSRVKREMRHYAGEKLENTTLEGEADLWWHEFGTVEIIHPYFGDIPDPSRVKNVSATGLGCPADVNPVQQRSDDTLLVGLFGGSFALGTYRYTRADYVTQLESAYGRKVELLCFAQGGYKQPQQLMLFNMLLAMGAEFDLVINLDGFNEVALPASENIPNGVNPYYPRMWNLRVDGLIDQQEVLAIGHLAYLKKRRIDLGRMGYDHHWYRSPFLSFLWRVAMNRLNHAIYELNNSIQNEGGKSSTYLQTGPAFSYDSSGEMFNEFAAFWRNASLEMNALCKGHGIAYYHFLQPNQYVAGSKPFSAQEKAVAINTNSLYAAPAKDGYKALIAAGAALSANPSIDYYDLTPIFSNRPEVLYFDDCCHVNPQGYRYVVDYICDRIIESYSGDSDSEAQASR